MPNGCVLTITIESIALDQARPPRSCAVEGAGNPVFNPKQIGRREDGRMGVAAAYACPQAHAAAHEIRCRWTSPAEQVGRRDGRCSALVAQASEIGGSLVPKHPMAEETLIQKIRSLPPERLAEVEDFGDFLTVRDQVRHFTEAVERLSEDAFRGRMGITPAMPTTTAYSFGDIALDPFLLTDQSASKKRRAVVVSSDAYHQRRPNVFVMAVTSQILRPVGVPGEVLIAGWRARGCPSHLCGSPFSPQLSKG